MRSRWWSLGLLVVLAGARAEAGFSARARFARFDGGTPVGGAAKLTGPTDKGDFGDAYLPRAVGETRLRQLLGAVARPPRYPVEPRIPAPELPLIPGSRLGTDFAVLPLDADGAYDKIELVWEGWAAGRPVDGLSATLLAGEELSARRAALLGQPEWEADRKSGSLKVTLFPRLMAPGTYPILLLAWSGDRALAHVVVARLEAPCARHAVNQRCRHARVERSRNDVRLGAAFEYQRAVLLRPDAREEGPGLCPTRGEGLKAFACSELERMDDELAALLQEKGRLDAFFEDIDCCRPDPDVAGGALPR